MSKRETVKRDIIDMDAVPTNNNNSSSSSTTTTTTTKPAVHNAAIPNDPFPCRMHKFQCTENDHFDSHHLPTLTQRLAQSLLKCAHPKCSKMVGKFWSMDHYNDHQLTVHHIKLRGLGGKTARSRKSSPAGGRRKRSKEPDLVVWSVESPATPTESFHGEGVGQAQDRAVETVPRRCWTSCLQSVKRLTRWTR
ncbi:hypothetical protein QQS21_006130 [Conoideocrella luteorostrata]|uniref:C2H2-type domain-containing protein n=1 Tax=Conoideocrella luteorostrata TaxID=1105319 RepID=A0AAJ0CNI8_9HYPO|nr:hypothetical protein QQS21_006130 [Conoideocrella luteorostrata]